MSGSIGGNRIKRENVVSTYRKVVENVLKGCDLKYRISEITGSYNAGIKEDHGDIDVVVLFDSNHQVPTLKGLLAMYINSCDYCVPFVSGRNKGKKSQIYGDIVTCMVPIEGQDGEFVQVDIIVTNTIDSFSFKIAFLNMDAAKQALLTGIVRIIEPEQICGIKDCHLEYCISTCGLSLRAVRNDDYRKHTTRWTHCDWREVCYLIDYNFERFTYRELLNQVARREDAKARKRILGVIKSVINIGVGEVGTPKGESKQKAIELAEDILG